MAAPASVSTTRCINGGSIVFDFACTTPKGQTFSFSRGEPNEPGASEDRIAELAVKAYGELRAAIEARVDELDSTWARGVILALDEHGNATGVNLPGPELTLAERTAAWATEVKAALVAMADAQGAHTEAMARAQELVANPPT